MLIKNIRILKNGAVGAYIYNSNNTWKWRIIKGPTKKGGSSNSSNSSSNNSSSSNSSNSNNSSNSSSNNSSSNISSLSITEKKIKSTMRHILKRRQREYNAVITSRQKHRKTGLQDLINKINNVNSKEGLIEFYDKILIFFKQSHRKKSSNRDLIQLTKLKTNINTLKDSNSNSEKIGDIIDLKCYCEIVKKDIKINNADEDERHNIKAETIDTNNNKEILKIKILGGGLGGDMIYFGKQDSNSSNCCKTNYIFKIFNSIVDQQTEIDTINILGNLQNNILRPHIPNMFYYGTVTDDTNKVMEDKIGYYLRSEAIKNLPLQSAIKYKCRDVAMNDIKNDVHKEYYKILNTKQNWQLIILQLFNILSIMTIEFFNHCDFHGDNILLSEMPKDKELTLDFSYIGIKDQPYIIDDTCLLMKLIDFDTGKFMETKPKIRYCSDWKSERSGTTSLLPKANELRKSCGLSYKTNTINDLPMGDWLKTRTDPVNGDWFNFGHFMACLNKSNLFPNLDMGNLWRLIKKFNQNNLNNYFNKNGKDIEKLMKYLKMLLRKIYFNLRS
jgi:hypothetical protein